MKKIKILLISLASSLASFAADFDITSGQLEGMIAGGKINEETLKLKGNIDARDLAAIEKLPAMVKQLDLSEVTIDALTMPTRKYFGRTLFHEGEIPAYTFFKSEINRLILPPSVSAIGEGAFAGSEISSIVIPEGVTAIGDYAFYGCPALTAVSLPSTLTSIGKGAFGNCYSLQTLDLSGTQVSELPEKAFAGAVMLESVSFPAAGLRKVGREAFSHTRISSLTLTTVQEFDAYALSGMPFLEELAINPSASIADGLLMDNISLATLTGMPEAVPDYFAANCESFETSNMGSALTLGRYSFANTSAPGELILPASLTAISRGALSGLSSIESIDATQLDGNLPEVDETSFEGLVPGDILLFVKEDYADLWKAHPVWSLFKVTANGETGIDQLPAAGAADITIALRGNIVVVESESAIADVKVFTTDGRIAFAASPGKPSVEISTDLLPSGVVIVAASDVDGNVRNTSLLLR